MMWVLVSILAVHATAPLALTNAFQSTPLARRLSNHNRVRPLNAMTDSALLSEMDALWQTYPYTAAALVCGFKASMADFVAQSKELNSDEEDHLLGNGQALKSTQMLTATTTAVGEETEASFSFFSNADWKRNAAFIAYGALYQGITQEYCFNHLYPVWFGTGTGLETVLTKVAFTLLVQTTILTLPSLYASKALIEGYSLQTAAQQYMDDIKYQGLLQKFYILWGPVLTLTFSVIPVHFRVSFIAVISFFWLIILSSISGNREEKAME